MRLNTVPYCSLQSFSHRLLFEKNVTSCSSTVNDRGLHCKGAQCLEDVRSACSHSGWNEWVGLASEPLIFTTPLPCTSALPGRDTGARTRAHTTNWFQAWILTRGSASCWHRTYLLSPLFCFTLFFTLALHKCCCVSEQSLVEQSCMSRSWWCTQWISLVCEACRNGPVVFAWCSSQKKRPWCGLFMSFTLFMADESQGILLLYHFFFLPSFFVPFCHSILSSVAQSSDTTSCGHFLSLLPSFPVFSGQLKRSLCLSRARSLTLWVCVYLCPYRAYAVSSRLSLSLPSLLFFIMFFP